MIIGIDPGSACGWAVLDHDGSRMASGVWNLSPGRHEGGGMRFVRLDRYLRELLKASPEPLVGYEEVRRHLGTDAAQIYGGIVATITRVCEEFGVPYRGVPVATVKRTATGKGNAHKDDMVATAMAHWYLSGNGRYEQGSPAEDEADALWVAEALRKELVAP